MKKIESFKRRDILKAFGLAPFGGMILKDSSDFLAGEASEASSNSNSIDPLKNQAWQLIQACRSGDLKKVELILKSGFPPDAFVDDLQPQESESPYKKTFPLFEAVNVDHFEIVRELIKFGADVNLVRKCEYYQEPSLGFARSARVMNLLIDSGADINFSFEGEQPIVLGFIGTDSFELFSLLIDRGLDLNNTKILGGGIVQAVCTFSYREPLARHFEKLISSGYCRTKALAEIECNIASIQLNPGVEFSEEAKLISDQLTTIKGFQRQIINTRCQPELEHCTCPGPAVKYVPNFHRVKFT